jgi:gamma-glutamylcyclotransferase (GGCT)/AIG2-like uncharacterized protein YtfP
MLYFAYGSNLNTAQMAMRCPDAEPMVVAELPNWKLAFRGVLDIEKAEGEFVIGVIWKITPKCLEALDRYEGVRSGLYRRIWLRVKMPGMEKPSKILAYKMNRADYVATPGAHYYNAVKTGYKDFGLAMGTLVAALEEAAEGEEL